MSLVLGRYEKQLLDGYDYDFDFSPWLLDREDTIQSFTVTTLPLGLVIDGAAESSGVVKFYARGGTVGVTYYVHCDIVTVGKGVQRNKRATMTIKVVSV